MPFELKNNPAIFQRALGYVLRDYIGNICYIYIDDVIVLGKPLDERLENLGKMKSLNSANLKVHIIRSTRSRIPLSHYNPRRSKTESKKDLNVSKCSSIY